MQDSLRVRVDGAVATITLERPDQGNVLDESLCVNLTQAFQKLGVAEAVHVIVLESQGDNFCLGADIGWLNRSAQSRREDNLRDVMALGVLVDAINRCPKPVLVVIQGPALGVGAALAAAADMALASESASFAITDVRLGMEPSVLAPILVAAMGARACRRFFLTGERFDAAEALRLGLVHKIVAPDQLAAARDHVVEAILKGEPSAQAAAKDLIRLVDNTEYGPDLMRVTAQRGAESRQSDAARQRLATYLPS